MIPIVVGIVVGVVLFFGAAPSEGANASDSLSTRRSELSTTGSELATTGTELATTGAELFQQQCSSCHGLDGRGVTGRGPSLEPEGEAAADFVLRTGRMPLAAPDLQATRGPVRYSESEIVALVAYVGSIGTGPGIPTVDAVGANVSRGGQLFRLNCAACHVTSGAGAPIGSGQQAPSLAKATATQVGEAILVGPGAMPAFGSLQGQQVNDIAAYIAKLQRDGTTAATSFGGAGPVAEGLAAWIIALIPLVALTRWIGSAKAGRDHPVPGDVEFAMASDGATAGVEKSLRSFEQRGLAGGSSADANQQLSGPNVDPTDEPAKRHPLLMVAAFAVLAIVGWVGRHLRPRRHSDS